ncbi:tripartite tricarboxylate transporter TctB family protein [Pseudonocardia sp. NPDC046786]|uniref:tripartite tricarboxylate transporter TctB family protein n=1 Tax=Pseudonocardia sp. NPDC046786 TaxID=3155471 RepID=UPI0034098DC9
MSAPDKIPAESPGATTTAGDGPTPARRPPVVEVAIASTLLVVFVVALALAWQWSFRAALTPLLAAGTGTVLSILHLVTSLTGHSRRRSAAVSGDETTRVLATAGRRAWTVALLWVGGFFLGTYVFGLALTGVFFALAYLRVQARAGWVASVVYATAVGLTVWVVFGLLFEIALPEGVLFT